MTMHWEALIKTVCDALASDFIRAGPSSMATSWLARVPLTEQWLGTGQCSVRHVCDPTVKGIKQPIHVPSVLCDEQRLEHFVASVTWQYPNKAVAAYCATCGPGTIIRLAPEEWISKAYLPNVHGSQSSVVSLRHAY